MKNTIIPDVRFYLGMLSIFVAFGCMAGLPTTAPKAYQIEQEIDELEHPLPIVNPMFDYHIRDVSICKGPGKKYYMTGTTDDNWGIAEGIRVWESDDLENWRILGEEGFVWTFEKDGHPWQKKVGFNKKWNRTYRGIWAPEIHYFKGTFWIPYSCSNVHDSGLLKSVSGKAEGPYVDLKTDGPLVEGIDATLVEDENGDIWYVWAYGRVHKMNDDMSGFDGEEYPPLFAEGGGKVGYEGVNIFRYGGKYHLIAAEWNAEGPENGHLLRGTDVNRRCADGRYDCMIATSEALLGPYSKAYIAAPHAGHNVLFTDHDDNLWATMFGNDEAAALYREDPGIVPLLYDEATSRFSPKLDHPLGLVEAEKVIYVDSASAGGDGSSWSKSSNDLQKVIDEASQGTQIWLKAGIYGSVTIKNKTALTIVGGFKGTEDSVGDRDLKSGLSIIEPGEVGERCLTIEGSDYLRIDGLQIRNANLEGLGYESNGAGMHIVGGGETVRVLNTVFENNRAGANGGAVFVSAGASPMFINCNFIGNASTRNGGAVYIDANLPNGYHVRFYNCRLSGNYAQHHGGAVFMRSIHKQTGLLRLINCEIDGNQSLLEKGVLTLDGGASLLMSHCEVKNNRGMANGSVVSSLGRVPAQNRIVNSIFEGNTGGYLFEGEGFIPGRNHPWTPGERAWTQFENNVFSGNQNRALLRRFFDAKLWENAAALDETIIGQGNQDVGEIDSVSVKNKGILSNAFPYDFKGEPRAITETDLPDVGLFELN